MHRQIARQRLITALEAISTPMRVPWT